MEDPPSKEMTMHEVEPEPLDDPDSPADSPSTRLQGTGKDHVPLHSRPAVLGLNSHSTVWWLSRIQRYSSYAFSVFSTFHVINTSLIPLITQSVTASEKYLLLTRPYYQSRITEPLLIALPLVAHVGSGVALRVYRRRQEVTMYGAEDHQQRRTIAWPKVSGTSKLGLVFLPLLVGHSYINRGIPLKVQGGSSSINLSYVSHAFARYPAVSFVGYAALVTVGVWHVVWGWAKYLRLTPQQVTTGNGQGRLERKKRWYLVNTVSAAVAAVWLAGGMGVVGSGGAAVGWLGREYDELYRSILLYQA